MFRETIPINLALDRQCKQEEIFLSFILQTSLWPLIIQQKIAILRSPSLYIGKNLTFSCCVHYHRISEPIRLTFIFVTHEINNKEQRRNNKETKTTVKTHNATLCVWLKGKRRFRWINNSRLNIVLRWTHKKGKSTTRRKTFFFVSVVTNLY